ncbi:UDP-N-acetylmuramate--L-alanine ligase [Cytophagaceae bacterium ABcell3]|nr:UDP-N-acetylmuramate--L-alanine ligase [Cytophagaceae bacterium ABcell3]
MNFNTQQYQNYFFVGIAGTGMSAIAQYLNGIGKSVAGSDRLFTQTNKMLIQEQFEKAGIHCFYQDGSGIDANTQVVVVSTAIEESNVEYQKALQLNIPIVKRSELLAAISSEKKTIAVGGTSGKSTTTAMIFHILNENGLSPSLITGAGLTALQKQGLPGNAKVGEGPWLVIESDESDGSIVNYLPETGVVLNIDRDHKEFDELIALFETFKQNTKGKFIVNNDLEITQKLSVNPQDNFGTIPEAGFAAENFNQEGFSISFTIQEVSFRIPVIGRHNMENAAAAVAAAHTAGVSVEQSAKALRTYEGIYRRTQLVGEHRGIIVIDDFAHNPAEVAAAIKSCQIIGKRVFAWFQPHGFGPLRFMHEELSEKSAETLRANDTLILSDVYYAGGTVNKDISSEIVTEAVSKQGKHALFIKDRAQLPAKLADMAEKGDVILLMGARDPSLSDFAHSVLNAIKNS